MTVELRTLHSAAGEDLGRTPPQDLAAEQSVLGGMLLSKEAIADVVEQCKGVDFYRPAHEQIYDAIIHLYGRGEPADAVTVADELSKRGELSRIGGPAYLHELIAGVPTAASAGYYAEIVAERAVLRRLVEAATRIVQMGYSGGDAEEIVNAAQSELYAVTEQRANEDFVAVGDVIEETIEEIEAAGSRSGEMVGVPTGFTDLDQLTNGLHPGQMIVLAARPAIGKALALDTLLPTPSGWTTMGEVAVGDQLISADGSPTRVTHATEVLTGRDCFELVFDDGTTVIADGEHEWVTETDCGTVDPITVKTTTRNLAAALETGTGHWSVNATLPVELPDAELSVPPYLLGAYLAGRADPAAHLDVVDDELVMFLEAEGLVAHRVGGTNHVWLSCQDQCGCDRGTVPSRLRQLGVWGTKRIPKQYLRAGALQRRLLLAGLVDMDGEVLSDGAVWLRLSGRLLAADVLELLASLGVVARLQAPVSESESWVVTFSTADEVFRLTRKQLEHKRVRPPERSACARRRVVAVRAVESVPVRCVQIDHPSHLYLASRAMVPTHNSTLGLDIARTASVKHGLASVVFSLEMSRREITMRLFSAEASVSLQKMRKGMMNEDDWVKLARSMGKVSGAPLFIDDSPNMSLMEIRAKCRRLKQRHNLKLVVIDYLQLMTSGKRVESRQQEVSEFSRALKLLAKEIEVPVIAISQLNRGPEQRTDKKPQMSDLRESGCLTADTRVLRADTGTPVSLGELLAADARDVPVWALDDSLRYVARPMTHVFPTGRREVFRLRTASGKSVRATGNHPFLTTAGWTPLAELGAGDSVAVPRHTPAPQRVSMDDDPMAVLRLAFQVADGVVDRVPQQVFSLPKRQITVFLQIVWSAAARVRRPEDDGLPGSVSWRGLTTVADDLALLLLRFGISVTKRHEGLRSVLELAGADDRRRFLQEIGLDAFADEQEAILHRARADSAVCQSVSRASHSGQVWGAVHRVLTADEIPTAGELLAASTIPGQRHRLSGVAALLDEAGLDVHAVNDVIWDKIVSVEPDGVEDVYDATVLGCHNFIADGFAVHNSIEQDADMVILLHREDAYEKESPRAGEADFIVAKHRNGPTDTITVAFQGHYSRFVDMAHGV